MNRDDIIKLAQAAAIKFAHWDDWDSNEPASGPNGNEPHEEREYWISVVEFIADVAYAAGAAAEHEKVAAWMMQRGFATGHGDTVDDLLNELEWQVAEREREACAKLCETKHFSSPVREFGAKDCAVAIRARGQE